MTLIGLRQQKVRLRTSIVGKVQPSKPVICYLK